LSNDWLFVAFDERKKVGGLAVNSAIRLAGQQIGDCDPLRSNQKFCFINRDFDDDSESGISQRDQTWMAQSREFRATC
jgi:hypothetical protein